MEYGKVQSWGITGVKTKRLSRKGKNNDVINYYKPFMPMLCRCAIVPLLIYLFNL